MNSVLVDDLVVRYGDTEAVRGASFSVRAGSVFGLLGPNGAGKTSVVRVLTTLVKPAAGRCWVLGHDVAEEGPGVRRLIGYVPQALSADGSLTGRENASLFARLYDVPRRARRGRVDEALALMGLRHAADELVRTYSGGMVRRLEIACALLHRPRVLLLDELTVGLDPIARRTVWSHLRDLRAETDMTVLLTTHHMEEAEEQCDGVAVMSSGRVVAEGTPGELRAEVLGGGGTLEDVFVALADSALRPHDDGGGLRAVSRSRRTARRLG